MSKTTSKPDCEHKEAFVLIDLGQTTLSVCSWGCGQHLFEQVDENNNLLKRETKPAQKNYKCTNCHGFWWQGRHYPEQVNCLPF